MSNSKLATVTMLSPNHSGKRKHAIDTVTIHCMAGNLKVETCGKLFLSPARQASSNYGIGSDGRIAIYVDEDNRSWCSSNAANDNRAVTIEVANKTAKEPFAITQAAYDSLINLLVDICQRNGIKKLLWKADKSLIGKVEAQNMTVHRWFSNKSCPGTWLYEHHGQIADEVNARLEAAKEKPKEQKTPLVATGYDHRLSGRYKVTASDGLNVRRGAGTEYEVLHTLNEGEIVYNYGYYTEKKGVNWLYIRSAEGESVGYVNINYLNKF